MLEVGDEGHILTGLWHRRRLRRLGDPVIPRGDAPLMRADNHPVGKPKRKV
jgi:hypothetical protein